MVYGSRQDHGADHLSESRDCFAAALSFGTSWNDIRKQCQEWLETRCERRTDALTPAGCVGAECRKWAAFANILPVVWGQVLTSERSQGSCGCAVDQLAPIRNRPRQSEAKCP